MKTLFTIILVFVSLFANAQGGVSISITGSQPHPSAGLDVDFSNKGLLLPRVNLLSSTDVATIASPAAGLVVYNTNGTLGQGLYLWNGALWAMQPVHVLNKQVTTTGSSGVIETFAGGEFSNISTTDKVYVQMVGSQVATAVKYASAGNGFITITFTANPSYNTVLNIMAVR